MTVSPSIFLYILIFLSVPFVCAYILKRIGIPSVIGYIIGGVILGNLFSGITTSSIINQFAYFGIVLLMFTIGLEINFEKLFILKRFIILGGLLQIFFSLICIAFISSLFQFSFLQSILIGIALSASSTSLVAKIIQEKGEESTFLGELVVGILMFQDLAFIPFIIAFSSLQTGTDSLPDLLARIVISSGKALIILAFMYYVGKRVVGYVFNKIARSSREILNVFIVIFIVFVAYVSVQLHIPVLIGIFIAGVLVSQTLEHYHIFSQIRPLRDIFSTIFFVFIGSHINLTMILMYLPQILMFSLVIMFIKAAIIFAIFIYFRLNTRLAFSLATFLFQISETSFILLTLAYTSGIFTHTQYLFIISAALVSLIFTPIVINSKEALYIGMRSFFKRFVPPLDKFIKYRIDYRQSSIDVLDIKNHVVICGYGRVGSYVGRACMLSGIPFIAIDYNFHTVEKSKREGVPIMYGDPTDIDILDFAQTEHAVALVSVVPERYSQEAITLNAKKLNPNIIVISRIHNREYQSRLKDLGVDVVIQPEFEASLSIIKKIFLLKKLPREEVVHKIRHLKVEQGII